MMFDGPTGLIGEIGSAGPNGAWGPTGIIGVTGPFGVGILGYSGMIGVTGSNYTGVTGPIGSTGPTGTYVSITGSTGITGMSYSGRTGRTGPIGPTASITGPTGPTGPSITQPANMETYLTGSGGAIGYKQYGNRSTIASLSGVRIGKDAAITDKRAAIGVQCAKLATTTTGATNQRIGGFALNNYAGSVDAQVYGANAFRNITYMGDPSIAVGSQCGQYQTIGSYITVNSVNNSRFFGFNVMGMTGVCNYDIVIGNSAYCPNNTVGGIVLGNPSMTKLYCNVTSITSTSDIRDKDDITLVPNNVCLDLVQNIKPVCYQWNPRNKSNTKKTKEYGFVAQNLIEVKNNSELKEYLDITDESDPESLKIKPTNLIPILIQAIKELSDTNDRLYKLYQEKIASKE